MRFSPSSGFAKGLPRLAGSADAGINVEAWCRTGRPAFECDALASALACVKGQMGNTAQI